MRAARRPGGFTLVELVVVLALLSVLSAVAMSRFASREPFALQAATDQLVSGLRLAQATATAQRQTVFVALSASPAGLQVCLDAACTQPLPSPSGDLQWLAADAGVALAAAASFSFNAAGAPSFASALTLQVVAPGGGSDSNTPAIVVEAVSGHVHSP